MSTLSISKYSNFKKSSEVQLFRTESNQGVFQVLIFPKDNISLFFIDPEGVIKELNNKYTKLNVDERISVIKKVINIARSSPIFLSELHEDHIPNLQLNKIQNKSWFCLKLIDLAILDFRNAEDTHMSLKEVVNLFKEDEQYFFERYSSPNYA